jgi:hypothetical protein
MKTFLPISFRGIGLPLLFCATLVHAESVLPSTPSSARPPAGADASAGDGKSSAKSMLELAQSSNLPLLKRGPVSARPHLFYRILYADGLLDPTQRADDSSVIQTVSPGVLFEIGDSWTVDYTYSRITYSSRLFHDKNEHNASVSTGYKRERWAFTGTESYSNTAPLLAETGTQTPQEQYSTDLSLVVYLGPRTQLNTGASVSSRHTNSVTANPLWTSSDWTSWQVSEMLQRELGPRLNVSAGLNAGYDSVKPGADMSHIQPTGRITWVPTNKISVTAQAGIERRKFKSGRGSQIENPVYRGSLQYAPFNATKLSASVSRAFSASYFANWATRSTGWSTGIEQRLLQRYYLNLDYTESETRYIQTNLAGYLNRNDNAHTIGARLSTPILGAGSLTFVYQNGRDNSTERGFSFVTHQYGAEISYRF